MSNALNTELKTIQTVIDNEYESYQERLNTFLKTFKAHLDSFDWKSVIITAAETIIVMISGFLAKYIYGQKCCKKKTQQTNTLINIA